MLNCVYLIHYVLQDSKFVLDISILIAIHVCGLCALKFYELFYTQLNYMLFIIYTSFNISNKFEFLRFITNLWNSPTYTYVDRHHFAFNYFQINKHHST